MTTEYNVLYRFFDADGALLYVGITCNPTHRFRGHAYDKPWWTEVRQITLEPHPDRRSVVAAEANAIVIENPRWNAARPAPMMVKLLTREANEAVPEPEPEPKPEPRTLMGDVRRLPTIPIWHASKPNLAAVLGISRGTAYALAKNGDLPTIHLGHRVVVPVPALLAFLGEKQ